MFWINTINLHKRKLRYLMYESEKTNRIFTQLCREVKNLQNKIEELSHKQVRKYTKGVKKCRTK